MTIAILENYIPEPNSGCWLWLRGVNSDGYPLVRIDGKSYRVNRLIWEIFKGPLSSDVHVCHKCDIRLCINPEHLFIGTPKENYDDMVAKGRKAKFDYTFAKLSSNDIKNIRDAYETGRTQKDIADQFGVNRSYISEVVNFKRPLR